MEEEIKNLRAEIVSLRTLYENNKILNNGAVGTPKQSIVDWEVALDDVPIPIMIYGTQGIKWVNNAMEGLLGYEKNVFIKHSNEEIHKLIRFPQINSNQYLDKSSNPINTTSIIKNIQINKSDGEEIELEMHVSMFNGYSAELGYSFIASLLQIPKETIVESTKIEAPKIETEDENEFTEFISNDCKQLKEKYEKIKVQMVESSLMQIERIEYLENVITLSKNLCKNKDEKAAKVGENLLLMSAEKLAKVKKNGNSNDMFALIDPEFCNRLFEKYPTISNVEFKICFLAKQLLDNKEISSTLSLSVRTIEHHILQIRKKMGLKGSDKLNKFLMKI